MNGIFFSISIKALFAVIVATVFLFIALRWRRSFVAPHINFSNLKDISQTTIKVRLGNLPEQLLLATLIFFFLAFIDPHLFINRQHEGHSSSSPTEGIAIYLVLDQSGSMKETVPVETPEGIKMMTKVDLLKQVSTKFVEGDPELGLQGRPNDLIGLIFFSRAARVVSPLTLDHTTILKQLSRFTPVATTEDDGTSIGYAIYKTASMIAATRHYAQELIGKGKPAYQIKSYVMVLVTDGMQDPNPLDKGKRLRNIDVPEAADFAKEQGIRLYVVNVEPKLATEEFAPYRHLMQKAAEKTGGRFFTVDNRTSLEQIYKDIDSLEKSEIFAADVENIDKEKRPDLYRRLSLSPYLILIGLCCFFSSLLLETTLLRKLP